MTTSAQPSKPTMGSIFAGIGGFDLGFERAGFDVLWQIELDPWCRRVLAKNFPDSERHEDVREIRARIICPVDVICAGFPCQDISYAGLGAGIDGERSGLVTEAIRLVAELRPRFVLLENVAALLGRGLSRVLGYLAEIGYDAEWEVVSASDAIETDHLRERVWILAYPHSERYSQRDNDSRPRKRATRIGEEGWTSWEDRGTNSVGQNLEDYLSAHAGRNRGWDTQSTGQT